MLTASKCEEIKFPGAFFLYTLKFFDVTVADD
jgi:hypothetical protein